jgi:hypothetical protein
MNRLSYAWLRRRNQGRALARSKGPFDVLDLIIDDGKIV